MKAIKGWALIIQSRALPAGLLVAILFFTSVELQPVLAQGLIQEENGTLVDFVASFSARIIPDDSEMYVPPNDTDLNRMQQLVFLVMTSASTNDAVNLSESLLEASRLGYDLIKLTNEKTGIAYYVLRETAGKNRGWGLYIFRAGVGSRDLVIEAPHPVDDLYTDRIGIMAFSKSKAKVFLMAGARREANRDGSSDAAHSSHSIFEVVHETVTKNSTTIIQVHGFTLIKNPGYPQIVLSSGDGLATSPVSELSSILKAKGLTTEISGGGALKKLEAATNVQGKYTNSIGATFIHIELESSVREDSSKYRKVVSAISEFASRDVKKLEVERLSEQLIRGLWYYIAAALIIAGALIILLKPHY